VTTFTVAGNEFLGGTEKAEDQIKDEV